MPNHNRAYESERQHIEHFLATGKSVAMSPTEYRNVIEELPNGSVSDAMTKLGETTVSAVFDRALMQARASFPNLNIFLAGKSVVIGTANSRDESTLISALEFLLPSSRS